MTGPEMEPCRRMTRTQGVPIGRRPRTINWISLTLAAVMVVAGVTLQPATAAASDTTTRWETFSESSGCGEPFTRTPFTSKQGGLANSELILGPYGTYFGRTIALVRSHLVDWVVPGSGGRVAKVHRAVLPALQKVEANLAAEAGNGRVYQIHTVYGFNARTVAGSYQVSRHGLGLAIDINPAQNPHRSDNRLITDMPQWFVDAWRSAGFCWGGDWNGIKDPMHFSWMGPGADGSTPTALAPTLPVSGLVPFGGPAANHTTPFGPVMARYSLGIDDVTGNGAPDVVGLRSHPDGAVIDIATSTAGYGACSIGRWFVPDETIANAQHVVFGDVDADSGQDLIALSSSDETLSATVATRRTGFQDAIVTITALEESAVSVTAADFDGDHIADLWETTPEGQLRIFQGPQWVEAIHDTELPFGAPIEIAAGDRHGGDIPELYALYPGEAGSRVEVLTLIDSAWVADGSIPLTTGPESIAAVGAGDYDGDGRSDAQILDIWGTMAVYIGNTPTGIPASRWFLHPKWECDDNDVRLVFHGAFYDDDDSQFQANIESMASAGVALGCNPPFNDRFCPDRVVTRATMAAFLVRGLGLEENTHPGFADVDPESIFYEDIGRLATAGITLGCTPSGDLFCPDASVTRATMAAFLVRGLGLEENTHPGFADVDPESIFYEDIGRLATAGVTVGCTANGGRFCPDSEVTRGALAAFLDRAGIGIQS